MEHEMRRKNQKIFLMDEELAQYFQSMLAKSGSKREPLIHLLQKQAFEKQKLEHHYTAMQAIDQIVNSAAKGCYMS